jgi:hypothetical protein
MATNKDTTKATEPKVKDQSAEPKSTYDQNLADRPAVEQPETTAEIVNEGHEAKVKATDDTRVSMDDLNGDNIAEKLLDNPVAKSNREAAKYGTVEDQNTRAQ